MIFTPASLALAFFLTQGTPATPWNVRLAQIGRQTSVRTACDGPTLTIRTVPICMVSV